MLSLPLCLSRNQPAVVLISSRSGSSMRRLPSERGRARPGMAMPGSSGTAQVPWRANAGGPPNNPEDCRRDRQMPGRGVEVGIGAPGLAPRKVEFAADPLSLFYIPTTGRRQLRIIGREVFAPAIITQRLHSRAAQWRNQSGLMWWARSAHLYLLQHGTARRPVDAANAAGTRIMTPARTSANNGVPLASWRSRRSLPHPTLQ